MISHQLSTGKNGNGQGGPGLTEVLEREVYPRLAADLIYTHEAHHWKRSGDTWRGGCPWHQSKTGTSFSVTPSSLLWYCGGCRVGGGPIQYLYRLRGGSGSPTGPAFLELVRHLFTLAGVPFPERQQTPEQAERARRRLARQAILEMAYAHHHESLLASRPASEAARAFLHKRGLLTEDWAELQLGYCDDLPGLWGGLRQAGYSDQDIHQSAAASAGLAGYITFPWRDDAGRPLTIAGRWVGDPPAEKPKTTGLANPRHQGQAEEASRRSPLYLDRALRAGHAEHLILVEGLIDGAVAHAHGDARVIACGGSRLSAEQIGTLARRRIRELTISLDPDQAGDQNIAGLVRDLLRAGITPYVAPRLPEGQDPDEYILAHGIDAWRDLLEGAIHGIRWIAGREILGAVLGGRP